MQNGLYRPVLDEEGGEKITPVIETLGTKLRSKFDDWEQARRDVEEEWLKDLRAFNSKYDPDVEAEFGKNDSKIYISVTRTKTMAAYSRIIDMLFSSTMKPWGVGPTPVPEIYRKEWQLEAFNHAKSKLAEAVQSGMVPGDPRQFFEEKTAELLDFRMQQERIAARVAAEKMEAQIDDQLAEELFENHAKRSILEQCIMGTGAVKGTTMKIERHRSWNNTGVGWEMLIKERHKPNNKHVSIFNLYPDPYTTDLNDLSGIFERHILTKSQLRELGKNRVFDSHEISMCISDTPDGNHTELMHEIERRNISGINLSGNSGRYEVLEWWGTVDGYDLQSCGCEVENLDIEYQANVWICGSRVIMARMNPLPAGRIPYQLFPFERVPHQFWGVGPARMMRDSQATINASGRIMLNNLAWTSGPQIEVNMDMLQEGEDPFDLHPSKVWLRDGGDPTTPMLRQFQPANNASVMLNVMEQFRGYADEETSLPRYMHGEKTGATRTSSGLSMLMGAANLSIKSVIKNIDDYLFCPMIQNMYDWNMQWNPREDIKGDMRIIAKGSTSLVAKEIQSERMMQFMSMTANEIYGPKVNHGEILREVAKSMELPTDKVIRPEEDGPTPEQQQQMQMAQMQQQLDMAMLQAKINKLEAESYRARQDADTMYMVRQAEAEKDSAVAQRAIADISLQQDMAVKPPPLPRSLSNGNGVPAMPREVATQAQFA